MCFIWRAESLCPLLNEVQVVTHAKYRLQWRQEANGVKGVIEIAYPQHILDEHKGYEDKYKKYNKDESKRKQY